MEGKMSEKPRGENKHAMNRWVAAFMPLVMIGLAGYATWVLVVLIGSWFSPHQLILVLVALDIWSSGVLLTRILS